MTSRNPILSVFVCWALWLSGSSAVAADPRFDVNDVSFLWPAPKSAADVELLLPADEPLAAEGETLWPVDVFKAVLEQTRTVEVTNSAGQSHQIDFRPFQNDFEKPATWRVASIRFDPSAPGTSPMLTRVFGEVPQVRLVLQPVTQRAGGAPRVHDVAVHLVYNFVARIEESTPATRVATPDKEAFSAIVKDLAAIKAGLATKTISTAGPLTVHPGLVRDAAQTRDRLRELLRKHLRRQRLAAIAFMGIDASEPWIFFAMRPADGAVTLMSFPTLGGKNAQMLSFRGTAVMPTPVTKNVDADRGVHTAHLFERRIEERLDKAVFPEPSTLKFKDIPDLIANPQRAHFFNTDCVSCHTESSRRTELQLSPFISDQRYVTPQGISGLDPAVLPKDRWNVRNFGWFPGPGGAAATATQRTANEAAESAEYINRTYVEPAPQQPN